MSQMISWIHFGDLHLSGSEDQNYRDFLALMDEANHWMRCAIAFALLPGDNADDGEEDEYELVRAAISKCGFPVHAITGDHDVAAGSLDLFRKYISDSLHKSFAFGGYRFLLLNSVAVWRPPVFGLGPHQMAWLKEELRSAVEIREPVIVFMHAYPAEHGKEAGELRELFQQCGVRLVEMGHTHYNELANDGHIVYAATRSTGQVEEGPPGFSVTTLDGGVLSWKFKPIGEWPFVMITSPSDERLIVDRLASQHVVKGHVAVRARVWGSEIDKVTFSANGGRAEAMDQVDDCTWSKPWDSSQCEDGSYALTVAVTDSNGQVAGDRIIVRVNQRGAYRALARHKVDYENAVGEWREKHILGTQLGPNENGRHWPSRRERAAR